MKNRLASLIIGLALLIGSDMARSATLMWVNIADGDWNNPVNSSPNQVPGNGDNVIITQSGTYTVTDNCAMPWTNDLFLHHRRRTESWVSGNFQKNFCAAGDDHIPLNSSGIVVARHEPAPRVIFLNIATARGPPRSGDQSLYLLHNPLDRPATHFRPAPLRSKFHFHDLTSLLVSILETTQPPPIHVANEGVQI